MTGPEETVQFCFPRISMFPEAKPTKTSRFLICYIAGNSLNLANSALLPSDVIHFTMLLAQRFWRETVSLLDAM